MADAAEGTEQIRAWKDHLWDMEKLEKEFDTKFATGLTTA